MLDRLAGSSVAVDEDRGRRAIRRCAEVGTGHVEDPNPEPRRELGVVSREVGDELGARE
jgi:hypothetical protein